MLRRTIALSVAASVALAACSGEDSAPQDVRNATTANSVTVPTYTVAASGLTPAQTATVNAALDRIMPQGQDLVAAKNGALFFADPAPFAAVAKTVNHPASITKTADDETPTATSSTLWDKTLLAGARPLSASMVTEVMTAAMSGINLGDTGVQVSTGPVRLEMYSPSKKATTYTGQIGTTGARVSNLSGYPLVGPGNTFDVVTGPTGKVASAVIALRSYTPGPSVAVATGASAVQRCQEALAKTNAQTSTGATLTATLVYYAPPLGAAVAAIDPVLKCSGRAADGTSLRHFFVTARLDVIAALINPALWSSDAFTDRLVGNLELGTAYLAANARTPLGLTDDSTIALERYLVSWGMRLTVDLNDTAPAASFTTSDAGATGVDTTDLFWYTGHANGDVLQASSGNITVNTMRLGDLDLEWFASAACGPMQDTGSTGTWSQRLTPVFRGLHLFMGYATVSYDTAAEGNLLASFATGNGIPGTPVARYPMSSAWIAMAQAAQPSDVIWGVAGAQSDAAGTTSDCLRCFMRDIGPSEAGFEIWRLTGNS